MGAAPTARIGCYYALAGVKVAAVANRDDPTESAATSLFVAATPPLGS